MRQELFETAAGLQRQLTSQRLVVDALASRLISQPERRWATVARGSSGHAGEFFRHLAGLTAGQLVTPIVPSLFTVLDARVSVADLFLVAISQSGAGEDINTVVEAVRRADGLTLALTNVADSCIADRAQLCIDLSMGPETAVAATKTFLGTLAAVGSIVAAVANDKPLARALAALPEQIGARGTLTRAGQVAPLETTMFDGFESSIMVLGRGIGQAIAGEIALKFKEVCIQPAEAFSAVEFIHGPRTLVAPGLAVLILCLDDATRPGLVSQAGELAELGAQVVLLGPDLDSGTEQTNLRVCSRPGTGHPVTDAITLAFDMYDLLERRALARGLDPDQPPNVQKVTSTY